MRKKIDSGISLIELTVAMLLLGGVVFLLQSSFTTIGKRFNSAQKISLVSASSPSLRKQMERYFNRGIGIAFTATTAVTGYNVFADGAISIVADLRPCPTFDPTTSNIAANQTEVSILCCQKALTLAVNQAVPPYSAGSVTNVTSSCQRSPGLSIEEKSGGSTSTQCFPDFTLMDVSPAGFNEIKQTPNYQVQLFADTSNGKAGGFSTQTFGIGQFLALGNVNALSVDCAETTIGGTGN